MTRGQERRARTLVRVTCLTCLTDDSGQVWSLMSLVCAQLTLEPDWLARPNPASAAGDASLSSPAQPRQSPAESRGRVTPGDTRRHQSLSHYQNPNTSIIPGPSSSCQYLTFGCQLDKSEPGQGLAGWRLIHPLLTRGSSLYVLSMEVRTKVVSLHFKLCSEIIVRKK